MPVIAVINRKGGSGKSTLATHIAANFAREGHAVMLGDVDKQQSSRAWLRRRSRLDATQAPPIRGWILDKTSVARPPSGVSHLVLDTPGGLTGFDLARLVMWCDMIVMPLCNSTFDRESAAACHAELLTLPRVAGGRCRVGVVGMRVDRRTRGHESLQAWCAERGMHYLGSLRDTKQYVHCIERGLTLFDLPAHKTALDLDEWQPLLQWLREHLQVAAQATPATPASGSNNATVSASPAAKTHAASAASGHAQPHAQARLSQLALAGMPKPGFWSLLRRLWRPSLSR